MPGSGRPKHKAEHRRVAQIQFEEGVVTRNDVLQAEVSLAAARQKLLALTNRHENGWLLLNFLTGREAGFRGEDVALRSTTHLIFCNRILYII